MDFEDIKWVIAGLLLAGGGAVGVIYMMSLLGINLAKIAAGG